MSVFARVTVQAALVLFVSSAAQAQTGENPRSVQALLDQAAEELSAFEADKALSTLAQARANGAFLHREHLRYFELLGVANIYLEQKPGALSAFDMLLALDPGYAISYTLSPKVTFVFEEARQAASERARPEVHLSWQSGLKLDMPIRISIQVLADPKAFLASGVLYARLAGDKPFEPHSLMLPKQGETAIFTVPAIAPRMAKDETLELFLVASDRNGDEVLVVAGPSSPYRLSLAYVKPEPWYRKWWVWSIGALVVAAGTGIIVGVATYDEPTKVSGSFR
ncbi:MAG: hypothetical protein MUC50_22550 [Myxococcota bacterium]|jgi:hypothetical protein|nr:hypothetical protein [Myxococcota bacterium]